MTLILFALVPTSISNSISPQSAEAPQSLPLPTSHNTNTTTTTTSKWLSPKWFSPKLPSKLSSSSPSQFLSSTTSKEYKLRSHLSPLLPPPPPTSTFSSFEVHGWRWHTLSTYLDINLLLTYNKQPHTVTPGSKEGLKGSEVGREIEGGREKLRDYILDFNLATLTRIEGKVFYPWLRELNRKDAAEVGPLFNDAVEYLEAARDRIVHLTTSVSGSSLSSARFQAALSEVSDIISFKRRVADAVVVPAVVNSSTPSSQKRLNNRILRKLGVLDSRLHLVAMHEAVRTIEGEEGEREIKLWEIKIPWAARGMVGRWRKGYEERRGGTS
jgi:hypothetical protein